MANENPLGRLPNSFTAGGTIVKGNILKMDSTARTVIKTTAITDFVIGVALNDASSGDQVNVATGGICKVIAAAATTLNAELMPHGTTNGQVADASGATARSIGIGLEAAGAAGDIIEMFFLHCPKGPTN